MNMAERKLYSAEEAIERGWVKQAGVKITRIVPDNTTRGDLRKARNEAIEACIKLAEAEPEAGEPTPKQLERLKAHGVVRVARSAIRATKQSIIKNLRALRDRS